MGSLYIANVSRQRQVICYRLDINKNGEVDDRMRNRAALQQTIESGKQAVVGGDLHPNQMAQIIEQLSDYGMVGKVDVPNNLRGAVSLVFNMDAPVPRNTMMAAVQHNSGVKIDEGAQRRARAAIAAHEALQSKIDDTPKTFDVEFEQEEVSELDEKSIAQGFHVVEAEGPKGPPRGRRAA
jgi:hypothetical protein